MDEYKEKKERRPLLYRILCRTVLFLTFFLSSLLLFYVMGNYQLFVDENQNLILTIATVTAFQLVLFSASGLIVSIIFLFRKTIIRRRLYVLDSVLMAAALVYGVVFMFITRIIDFLSAGI
jgi:hypothetical protein